MRRGECGRKGWSILGFVIGIATSPGKLMMIPSLVVFAVITYLLLRPEANEYFSPALPRDVLRSRWEIGMIPA